MQEARDEGFDDERPVVGEVRGHVLEAPHLIVLGQQIEQRVEHDEDQPVPVGHIDVGEVADRDRDLVATGLRREAWRPSPREMSMPSTRTPVAASGGAIRPVPTASSSTGTTARQSREELDGLASSPRGRRRMSSSDLRRRSWTSRFEILHTRDSTRRGDAMQPSRLAVRPSVGS